jgi:hypothetical protein
VKLPLRSVFASLALLAAAPAAATILHVETNTQVGASIFGPFASLFTPGEAVRIRYSYDDAVPDTNALPGSGTFNDTVIALSAYFPGSGLSFAFDGAAANSIITTDNSGNFSDAFGVSATSFVAGSLLGGATPIIMTATFASVVVPGPPVLVVNQRPSLPPFSYLSGQLSLTAAPGGVTMTLAGGNGVAGVPEPGALLLVASALAGAALARRGQSRH